MRQSQLLVDPVQTALQADDGRTATAEYIVALSAELTRPAVRHRLDMLAYLLDMVRLEAEATVEVLRRSTQARQ